MTIRSPDPAYYDRPLLKEPVWEWVIPVYYFVGGLTGAALALGAAVQALRSKNAEDLVRRCHWIGFAGAGLSSGLLVYDLGRPARFFNMLRVFRPTSPMNVGAWILSGVGGASGMTLLLRGRPAGEAFGFASGIFGLGLATYTGVLVANSAIPLWQESRRVLPILFGASAMAAAGCAFEILPATAAERRITRTFGIVGQLAELAASKLMEKQAAVVPRVGLPLKQGLSGAMWKAAALCTAASIGLRVLPNPSKKKRVAVGVLGALGSLLMRFAVAHGGTVSSRDARASFHQQRG